MRVVIIAFATLIFCSVSRADYDVSLFGGFRSQSANTGEGTQANGNETSYQLGAVTSLRLTSPIRPSIGIGFAKRKMKFRITDSNSPVFNGTGTFEFSSLDLPIHVQYNLNEYLALRLGPTLSVILAYGCRPDGTLDCDLTDAKSIVVPIYIGAKVMVTSQVGIEAFYEWTQNQSGILGEFNGGVDNYRALGANVFFAFN